MIKKYLCGILAAMIAAGTLTVPVMADNEPEIVDETAVVEVVEETEEATEEVVEEVEEEATEEYVDESVELFSTLGDLDTVLVTLDGETALDGTTLVEAPDGTNAIHVPAGVWPNILDIGADSMLDMIWEMDVRFLAEGAGYAIRNKANNYGTCMIYNSGQLAIQTGGSAYTRYGEVSTEDWLHIELKGRYSAPDAFVTMTVYKYEADGTMTPFGEGVYPGVNLRNLSPGNKSGAKYISVNENTMIDNARVTLLAADELQITEAPESIKAGNSAQINYSATRQGDAITKPAVTWEIYDANDAAPLNDENITITAGGLLNVGLYAETKTIHVRATADTGVYVSVPVNVEAVNASGVKFDALTLTTEQTFVNADNPMTITATATKDGQPVELNDGDLIWYIADATDLRKLGDDLKLIKVENGVVTVDPKAVAQNITVRAADPSDIVRGSIPVYIKSSDALEGNDVGTLDRFITANACETELTNTELTAGSWDGTSYYKVLSNVDMAHIGGNRITDLIFEMDIRFDAVWAGFTPKRADNGKLSSCITTRENGGVYYLTLQTGSSNFTDLFPITNDKWYHITWLGRPYTYSSVILEEYDENGNRVNRKIAEVSRRNDPEIDHITVNGGTSVDNVRALVPSPTSMELVTDVQTVLAGKQVQGTAKAFWNEIEMLGLDGSTITYEIYDSLNQYPLENDKITVDANGLVTIDAMAPVGDVYLRVTAANGQLYASQRITILSSDVFEITGIGVNKDMTKLTQIDVNKNFDTYEDDVTFIMGIYDENGYMKAADYSFMFADALSEGANKVRVAMDLPTTFNKDVDTINVFAITTMKNIEGSEDKVVTAGRTDGMIEVTNLPTFDDSADVVVLVLKPGTDIASISKTDIAYFDQIAVADIAEGKLSLPVAGNDTGYIVKIGGSVNQIMNVYTGVAE